MPRKAKAPAIEDAVSDFPRSSQLRRRLAEWFSAHGRHDLPWRRTEDPYAVMVSEFMLQQTQVATVIPYFERWLERFPDFSTLADADESEVLHAWQGLGYYARARNLHRAAKFVAQQFGGELPARMEAIESLPGVGRYTAGAIASFAFDLPVAAVDANIARVLARLINFREPIDTPKGAERIWAAAESLLPEQGGRLHNSALMELGALICTARQPQCLICPVRELCAAAGNEPEKLPVKRPRRQVVPLAENCAWVREDGRVLMERQTGSRWRGLWKLPLMDSPPAQGAPLHQAEYPFTHHRITLRVFPQEPPVALKENQQWLTLEELAEVGMPSPHRRAVTRMLREGGA